MKSGQEDDAGPGRRGGGVVRPPPRPVAGRARAVVGLAAVLTAAGAAPAGGTDGPTEGTAAIRDTLVEGRYEGPNGARSYRLWVPDGPAPEGGRPLLLMLHGCTQDAADVAAGTRMDRRAGEEGWLVLYPEQPAEAHPQRCWRWYDPAHQSAGSGEPAVLSGMVEEVAREWGAGPGRLHVAGISAGGAMAAVLGATGPDRWAAVAVHAGVAYAAARGPQEALAAMKGGGPGVRTLARRLAGALDGRPPPPLLVVHGSADQAVAPVNARRLVAAWLAAGGGTLPDAAGDTAVLPPPDRAEEHEGGAGRPWRLRAWDVGGTPVELRTVEGLGHAWSGGSAAGSYTDPAGPSATDWTLAFFRTVGGSSGGGEGRR